jgi:hypothetical protein
LKNFDFKPIIIIGAARSGTNMLRDVLTSLADFSTWPCDEINYIWRYGNRAREDDEFTVEDVNSKNKAYIRKQFIKLHKKYRTDYIIEKTCANSLRVDYVDQIIPEAKYIHIYRDPVDVSASAKKRWKAPLDLKYILKKARYVPLQDIPFYAFKYLKNRLKRFTNQEKKLDYWGPKFKNFRDKIKGKSLIEISAVQWDKSVSNSFNSFSEMNKDVHHIAYEDFVADPAAELKNIINFINPELISDSKIKEAVAEVSDRSVSKCYKELDKEEIEKIKAISNDNYQNIKRLADE